MQIYDIQVNHLTNPLGFHMQKVSFSWKVKDAIGKQPVSTKIVVALDEAITDIIADTGYDNEASSLGYTIKLDLKPCKRYYWVVSVKTDADWEVTSEVQWFETAKMNEPWTGKWITCDNENRRHPFFIKAIKAQKDVKEARLYVSGLGLYEAYFNNKKIGNENLTPYSNDYNQWVQYQTYDVTEQIKENGTLSILLGNGWYKGRFGFTQREEKGYYGDEWKLIAEVRILYGDGTKEVIGTDESWNVKRSNITYSSLYDGEHRDDTLEETPIEMITLCEAPKGKLMARLSLPVSIHEKFVPIELLNTPSGEKVFDMGQIFSGIFRLKVHEPKGTEIRIQTGEILQNDNFYNDNLRTAKSEYIYISNGEETVIQPHFTYYGYRYVKITGVSNLKIEDFVGLALYSDIKEVGDVKTGHDLVNKLISNVRWGLKSNFLDVPTDCPQRDERMGWTGDAQVFLPTATYLTDSYAFYRKYLYDMAQEQKSTGGMVPNVIPSVGINTAAAAWGDAACIIPWTLYIYYGDKNILEEQYESMKSWVEYIRKVDGDNNGWRTEKHFGDWLALDHPEPSAQQVYGGTDEEYIANIYYAASAEILSKTAKVLGYNEDEREYRELAKKQYDLIIYEYFSQTGRCCIKTQTALTLALKYNLSSDKKLTVKQLEKLFEQNNNKLKTGFIGTPLICNVLSDNGLGELAYKLLLNENYPGWLREVKLGATTIWERWNSVLDDGMISGTDMNSLNHYAYGSILEWIFRHAAGLNITEDGIGCRDINITPTFHWDLKYIEATYDSPMGEYKSSWKILDITHVQVSVTVPFGCTAKLHLPYAKTEVFDDKVNHIFSNVKNGICYLESGEYSVIYETNKALRKIYSTNSTIAELIENKVIVEKLEGIFPLKSIPILYHSLPLRVIAAKFGGESGEDKMNYLDKILEQL